MTCKKVRIIRRKLTNYLEEIHVTVSMMSNIIVPKIPNVTKLILKKILIGSAHIDIYSDRKCLYSDRKCLAECFNLYAIVS